MTALGAALAVLSGTSLALSPVAALSQGPQRPYETPYDQELTVTTGEEVFVAGQFKLAEMVTLKRVVSSKMPGGMGIPFTFKIDAGDYRQSHSDAEWTYFCAPLDRATASFPGLGRVVSEGDCVGVRKAKATGRVEWVVDNSVHNNGMETIWSRAVKPSEADWLSFAETQAIANSTVEKVVTFDGFYGGLLTFTYVDGAQKREMKFDYDGKSEKMVGMLGKRMLVLQADAIGLRYKWVAPPESR